MIGNGILAFGVIFVVVIFVYMSLRLKSDKENEKAYTEIYKIELIKGFIGDSISLYVNDSLLLNREIDNDSVKIEVGRFADQSALLLVDNLTEKISAFDLSEKGGVIALRKEGDMIVQESR